MKRTLTGLFCAFLLVAAFAPPAAVAKDTAIHVELDGRPLDSEGPSAIIHGGRSFVNVVRITKGFNGLLTFGRQDRTVRLTIGHQSADFTIGSRSGKMNGQPTTFVAAPFVLNGDTYVPLDAIASLAEATLTVDTKHRIAHLTSLPVPAAT